MRLETDDSFVDYRYYTERGWFESDYFYPTHLGVVKKGAGRLVDAVAARMAAAELQSASKGAPTPAGMAGAGGRQAPKEDK